MIVGTVRLHIKGRIEPVVSNYVIKGTRLYKLIVRNGIHRVALNVKNNIGSTSLVNINSLSSTQLSVLESEIDLWIKEFNKSIIGGNDSED